MINAAFWQSLPAKLFPKNATNSQNPLAPHNMVK
jgi:hypothetical protein